MEKTLESQQNGGDQKEEEEIKSIAIWDLGSPLYDSYELVSVSYLIERNLMTLPSLGQGGTSRRLSNKISPAPDDHQYSNNSSSAAVLSINITSNTRDAKGSHSSMVNLWREFVNRRLWKRKKVVGQRKKHINPRHRSKAAEPFGFCPRFG